MSDEPRTPSEWQEAVKAILAGLMRPETPAQHKHGLMGTNPNIRSWKHGDQDVGDVIDGRTPNSRERFGIPSYEEKLEEWHETGVSPWQAPENTGLVPVDAKKLRRQLRRYRRQELLTRHLITRRPWEAWKTLRYGADYWRDC
jgi:hypothetical protein